MAWNLGLNYQMKGDLKQSLVWLTKAAQLEDNPLLLSQMVEVYMDSGQKPEAMKIAEELKRRAGRGHIPGLTLATMYMGLGDHDRAFALLDKAYEERAEDLLQLRVAPWFDPLRADPRFAALLRRMNFPG